MAYFSFKKSIDRRTFLRGSGVSLALPFLGAMQPAFTQEKFTETRRFVAVNAHLGFYSKNFFPKKTGSNYELSPYLAELKDHCQQFSVFSGLYNGSGGHETEQSALTSSQGVMTQGLKNSISLDQLMAAQNPIATRYPSLTVAGAVHRSLSWTKSGARLQAIDSPLALYKKLFINGTEKEVKAQLKEIVRGRSVIDTILAESSKVNKTLDAQDKAKLDQYLTSVRELEVRLQQNQDWIKTPKPNVDLKLTEDPKKVDTVARLDLMYKLFTLALQTNSSRVISYNLLGAHIPAIAGVNTEWHNLSHHGKDESKLKQLSLIEFEVIKCFNKFLTGLKEVKENDQTLLDQTAVLLMSNLGNASSHDNRNLPVLVAGGNFKHGTFSSHSFVPLANLHCQLGNYMGLNLEKFGNSKKSSLLGFS